jgi:Xaa-Pro dipeptidase
LKSEPAGAQVNWTLVESLIPFGGIRVEDNVLVTEDQPMNFTREAFEDVG